MEPWHTLWLGFAKVYLALFTGGFRTFEATDWPDGPKIIITNHPSVSAMFILPFVLAKRCCFTIQADAFDFPILGPTLGWAGHIPVEKGEWTSLIALVRARVESGLSVIIYPEGQLSPRNGFAQPHSGAVRLSLATGTPIVPVGLYCSPKHLLTIRFRHQGRMRNGIFQVGGKSYICVGAPWYPPANEPLDRACIKLWSKDLMDQVIRLVERARTRAKSILYHPEGSCSV